MRVTWTHELPEGQQLRERGNALVFQMEQPEVFYTWNGRGSGACIWERRATVDRDRLPRRRTGGVAALTRSSRAEQSFSRDHGRLL